MIRIKKIWIYIDTLIIHTLWCEFLNDFDAVSDFGKNFVTKNYSYLIFLTQVRSSHVEHTKHNRSAHVSRSGRSGTDAVTCNWMGFSFSAHHAVTRVRGSRSKCWQRFSFKFQACPKRLKAFYQKLWNYGLYYKGRSLKILWKIIFKPMVSEERRFLIFIFLYRQHWHLAGSCY